MINQFSAAIINSKDEDIAYPESDIEEKSEKSEGAKSGKDKKPSKSANTWDFTAPTLPARREQAASTAL